MNNIYVETMPETLAKSVNEDDVNTTEVRMWFKSDVAIKPLSDRLAEERKKVVQDLKNWCDKNFNWVGDGTGYDGQDYNEMIGSNNTINKLREVLDRIERGE